MTEESLRSEHRELKALVEMPAFKRIVAGLQAEVDAMQNEIVLRPLLSADEVYKQEYNKGRVEGRLAFSANIETRLEQLEYEINQLKEKTDEN